MSSMVTRFEKAPLAEVIAELRWNTAHDAFMQQALPGVPLQIPTSLQAESEAFFQRFSEAVDAGGFRNSERLLPYGSPTIPGQALLRFRMKAGLPPLLQVGDGVFTANGLPPTYTHWGDFRRTLRFGIDSLLSTRSSAEGDSPFLLSVRYVDAFDERFWAEVGSGRFVDETLGFGATLPKALTEHLDAAKPRSAAHQLALPLLDGSNLYLAVGEGQADGKSVVILDVNVQTSEVSCDADSVMAAFDNNHSVIRDLFFGITAPIHDLMSPVEIVAEEDSAK